MRNGYLRNMWGNCLRRLQIFRATKIPYSAEEDKESLAKQLLTDLKPGAGLRSSV